jgi:glutaredoxin 3
MVDVVVYTTVSCPYCVQAKRLLDRKGVPYREIDVSIDAEKRMEMMKASGRRTVPQIFIAEQPIGGFDELYELEQSGRLDGLLDGPA